MNARELLAARGADGLAHPGGTLAAHLDRVGDALAAHGAPAHVVAAGRAHAAYGTAGFPTALLDPATERPLLRDLIGPAAEALVHRYCGWDRADWGSVATHRRVTDRVTGAVVTLDPGPLRELLDLAAANELDVLAHAAFGTAARDALLALLRAWAPACSPGIAHAVRTVA